MIKLNTKGKLNQKGSSSSQLPQICVHFRLKEEDVGNVVATSGEEGITPLQAAALKQLPMLMKLRTLVLKDFGGAKVTHDLIFKLFGFVI